MAEINLVWKNLEDGRRELSGVMMDPREFLPLYLRRFLHRRELEGDLPVAGNYEIEVKVSYYWCSLVEARGPIISIELLSSTITLLALRNTLT